MPTSIIPDRTASGALVAAPQPAFPDSEVWSFAGTGIEFSLADTDTTGSGELVIPERMALNGCALLVDGQQKGDWARLDIVSSGAVPLAFGPAGTVLKTFSPKWYLDWQRAFQGEILLPYRGTLVPGMAVKITVTKQAGSAMSVYANLFLHQEVER